MAEKELRLGYVRGRDGTNGKDGVDGKSPYQVAVEEGYTGTEKQLYAALASLIGAPFLPTAGGTMTGALNMGGQKISSLGTPVASTDAVTKDYVDKAKDALSKSIDGKTSKTPPAASGNLAALDAEGNLTDSGKKASDFTGKRVCRFVVGTSTAGWTAADCDYLCDGTDDQVEINAAIQALPSTGGEVVILDGTYNITAYILLNKANSVLSGSGAATILKRAFSSGNWEGIVEVRAKNCTVRNIGFDGQKATYDSPGSNSSVRCYSGSGNTVIQNCLFNLCACGVQFYGSSENIASSNIFLDCNTGVSVGVYGNKSLISMNKISNCEIGIGIAGSTEGTFVSNNQIIECEIGVNVAGYFSAVCNVISDCETGITNSVTIRNSIIAGNLIQRGDGASGDYTSAQHTINLDSPTNCLVLGNLIMGKNYVVSGGSNNTFVNNKYQ